jgi:hypothetical protein
MGLPRIEFSAAIIPKAASFAAFYWGSQEIESTESEWMV